MTDTQTPTRTIKVSRPNYATSKQDEIDAMSRLVDLFAGSGSYLESFFSQAAFRWFEQNVRDDYAPDLFGQLTHERSEAEKAQKANENEIYLLKRQVEKLQNELETAKRHNDDIGQQLADAYTRLHTEQETAGDLRVKISVQDIDLGEKDEQIRKLEDQIVRLKARLFDLMEK